MGDAEFEELKEEAARDEIGEYLRSCIELAKKLPTRELKTVAFGACDDAAKNLVARAKGLTDDTAIDNVEFERMKREKAAKDALTTIRDCLKGGKTSTQCRDKAKEEVALVTGKEEDDE